MPKLIFLCHRRPELRREAYARLVLQEHVPLALRHHPTLRRYVVNLAEGTPPDGEEIDSLPSLHFDTLEDFTQRLYDSAEGEQLITRDTKRFLARPAAVYATTEHIHRAGCAELALGQRTPGRKWICPLRRDAVLSRADFHALWLVEGATRLLAARPEAECIITNTVDQRLSAEGEDWDAFVELTLPTAPEEREGSAGLVNVTHLLALEAGCFVERALAYPVGEYVQRA